MWWGATKGLLLQEWLVDEYFRNTLQTPGPRLASLSFPLLHC